MKFELTKEFISDLSEAIASGNVTFVSESIGDLHPADVAELLEEFELENEEQLKRFVEGMAIKKMSKQKRQLLDDEIEAYSKNNLMEE